MQRYFRIDNQRETRLNCVRKKHFLSVKCQGISFSISRGHPVVCVLNVDYADILCVQLVSFSSVSASELLKIRGANVLLPM